MFFAVQPLRPDAVGASEQCRGAPAARSARFLLGLGWEGWRNPARFRLARAVDRLVPELRDPQQWDPYWSRQADVSGALYEAVAGCYRRGVITPNLTRFVRRHFAAGAELLHAGCGSGGSDQRIPLSRSRFHFLDLSPVAVKLHQRQPMNFFLCYAFCLPIDSVHIESQRR